MTDSLNKATKHLASKQTTSFDLGQTLPEIHELQQELSELKIELYEARKKAIREVDDTFHERKEEIENQLTLLFSLLG